MLHDMAVTRERVAEQLLALRQLHGTPDKLLSQEKAAQRAGVSTRDWQRWETKKVTPQAGNLSKVAEKFNIPLDAFDDGKVDRSSTPLADRLDEIEGRLDNLQVAIDRISSALGLPEEKSARDVARAAGERIVQAAETETGARGQARTRHPGRTKRSASSG